MGLERVHMLKKEGAGAFVLFCKREKDTLNPTLNWLNAHELLYDEVRLENDKSILFENCYAVIDDSTALLEKAFNGDI